MDLRDAAYRVSGLIPELALTLLLSLSELLTLRGRIKMCSGSLRSQEDSVSHDFL